MTVDPHENDDDYGPSRLRPLRSGRQKIMLLVALGVAGMCVAGGAYWFAGMRSPPEEIRHTQYKNEDGEAFARAPVTKVVARPPPPAPEPKPTQQTRSQPRPSAIPDPQLSAPISIQSQAKGESFLKAKSETASTAAEPKPDETGEGGEDNELSKSLVKSNLGPKSKAYVDKNYFYKLYPGSTIDINHRTAKNSQLPGFIMANVQYDVKNDDGFVLIPAGSKIFGQLKDGVIFGNDRVPVLWTQIQTNDHPKIIVNISNPGADKLGRPGSTGEINNHILEQALAVLTYTLIEAVPNAAIAALQNLNRGSNSTDIQYNTFVSPSQSLAGRVLDKYMNIKPTLEAPPGVTEKVIVGTEIDFSAALDARFANPERRVQQ